MFVNVNEETLPVTASSTPTAYAVPNGTIRLRVMNDAGDTVLIKMETSSSATLVAPVAGTKQKCAAIADQACEIFSTSEEKTYISVYSAAGTGTVYIQFTMGQ